MPERIGGDGIPTGRLRRAAPVATLAAQGIGEAVIATLRRGRSVSPEEYAKRAERYVELLGRSKGALMKMGQILSYVPFGSAVPPENRALFQAAMSRLQANAPPMSPELAARVDVYKRQEVDRNQARFLDEAMGAVGHSVTGQNLADRSTMKLVHARQAADGVTGQIGSYQPHLFVSVKAVLGLRRIRARQWQSGSSCDRIPAWAGKHLWSASISCLAPGSERRFESCLLYTSRCV